MNRGLGRLRIVIMLLALGSAEIVSAESLVHRSNRGEPTTLDPHKTPNGWETTIDLELFMGLTSGSAEAKVLPGMAESWSADDDGLGFTFHLRDDLTWSDGAPLTAEDFVWSFRRMLDPATASPYASLHYPIVNARAVNTGAMPPSALGVHAPDPRTISLRLSRPAPYYPQLLIHRGLPAPRHAIKKFGDDWTKAGVMVSNGAFTLAEWVPQTHVRVDRNARFFDAANVKIDRQYFVPAENAQSAFQMVRSGQLDTLVGFPPEQINLIRRELPDFLRLHPLLGVEYIVFNVKQAPFDDRRVRRALSMLIDRDLIAEKVLGTGERPAWSMVHPETMPGKEGLRPALLAGSAGERRVRARALLNEAGFGRDKPLAFEFRTSANDIVRRMAVAVTAMWKAAGVEARIVNSDMPVLFSDIREGNFSVARAEWYPEVVDPETYLYLMKSSSGPMNQSGYANADFDRAMDGAAAEGDAERRLELYRAAEEIAAEDQPLAPVFFYAGRTLVNPRVFGWADHTRNLHPGRFLSIR